jgi:hypothetical protein
MKIFTSHDDAGNIHAVAIPAGELEGGEMSLEPEPGGHVSELDIDVVAGEKRHEFLNDLMRNYRVERTSSKAAAARLVKKGHR